MTQQRSHNHQHKVIIYSIYSVMLSGAFIASSEAIRCYGINSTVATLLIGMVIMLAGLLLHPRAGFVAALIAMAVVLGIHNSNVAVILVDCAIFGLLALIPWLYDKKIQHIEARVQYAETALSQQKLTFVKQQKARAAEMSRLQLEEMIYMYRFAELGQMGVILLHDMANYLAALSLAVDELPSDRDVKAIAHIRKILGYIESTVENTRERLYGGTKEQTFDMSQKIGETIAFLEAKAAKANVVIEWQQPAGQWEYKGDVFSLCQAVAIVASNAIDAYGMPTHAAALASVKRVAVSLQRDESNITIRISDWGKGISKHARRDLFRPIHSKKKSGLGLGLYIAKQVIEMQFSGTISLSPQSHPTEFIIKIPIGAKLEV